MNGKTVSSREPRNERQFRHFMAETIEAAEWERSIDAASKPFPRCLGNCSQGRGLCVTPQACRLPESRYDKEGQHALTLLWLAVLVGAIAAVVVLSVWI